MCLFIVDVAALRKLFITLLVDLINLKAAVGSVCVCVCVCRLMLVAFSSSAQQHQQCLGSFNHTVKVFVLHLCWASGRAASC